MLAAPIAGSGRRSTNHDFERHHPTHCRTKPCDYGVVRVPNEQALRAIADCLCTINSAAEECFIAHDGDKYELGTSSQMNEADSEEEEEVPYFEWENGKSDGDDSDIE